MLDEQHVYAVGAQGQFHCLSRETGKLVWRRLLHKDYQVRDEPCRGRSPLNRELLYLRNETTLLCLGLRPDAPSF